MMSRVAPGHPLLLALLLVAGGPSPVQPASAPPVDSGVQVQAACVIVLKTGMHDPHKCSKPSGLWQGAPLAVPESYEVRRVNSMTQLVSQVSSPSVEYACSQRADVGVMFDQM
jgi:hypothetical protein